jgi:CheY-like chemotaxis protein
VIWREAFGVPHQPRSRGARLHRMPGLKFLIVDDSPVIRLTLTQALIRAAVDPVDIFEAETFHEAVEVFDEEHPSVLFLDISLPEGRPLKSGPGSFLEYLMGPAANTPVGSAAVRHMRTANPELKIVICTGNPPEDARVQELQAEGVFQFIPKPIDPVVIGAVVHRLRAVPG